MMKVGVEQTWWMCQRTHEATFFKMRRCSDDVMRLGTSKARSCGSMREAGTAEWGRKAKALPSVFYWQLMLTLTNTVIFRNIVIKLIWNTDASSMAVSLLWPCQHHVKKNGSRWAGIDAPDNDFHHGFVNGALSASYRAPFPHQALADLSTAAFTRCRR